jgi:hypothetical protein
VFAAISAAAQAMTIYFSPPPLLQEHALMQSEGSSFPISKPRDAGRFGFSS